MGKTIRNYNGDGLTTIKRQKTKKSKKKFRVNDFYDEEDYNDYSQRNDDNLQADNDN